MTYYPRIQGPKKVYFIRPIGMAGPIKIGCSLTPDARRSSLETWSPFPLEIIAEIEGGLDIERRFHTQFGDLHRGREWFDVSAGLLLTIDQINAGTFDLNSLPVNGKFPLKRRARDLSFLTAGWKYNRSVETRLRKISWASPAHWQAKEEIEPKFDLVDLDEAGVAAIKPQVEAAIAEFARAVALLPPKVSAA